MASYDVAITDIFPMRKRRATNQTIKSRNAAAKDQTNSAVINDEKSVTSGSKYSCKSEPKTPCKQPLKSPARLPCSNFLGRLRKTPRRLASYGLDIDSDSGPEITWDNNSPSPTKTFKQTKSKGSNNTKNSEEICAIVQKLSRGKKIPPNNDSSKLFDVWMKRDEESIGNEIYHRLNFKRKSNIAKTRIRNQDCGPMQRITRKRLHNSTMNGMKFHEELSKFIQTINEKAECVSELQETETRLQADAMNNHVAEISGSAKKKEQLIVLEDDEFFIDDQDDFILAENIDSLEQNETNTTPNKNPVTKLDDFEDKAKFCQSDDDATEYDDDYDDDILSLAVDDVNGNREKNMEAVNHCDTECNEESKNTNVFENNRIDNHTFSKDDFDGDFNDDSMEQCFVSELQDKQTVCTKDEVCITRKQHNNQHYNLSAKNLTVKCNQPESDGDLIDTDDDFDIDEIGDDADTVILSSNNLKNHDDDDDDDEDLLFSEDSFFLEDLSTTPGTTHGHKSKLRTPNRSSKSTITKTQADSDNERRQNTKSDKKLNSNTLANNTAMPEKDETRNDRNIEQIACNKKSKENKFKFRSFKHSVDLNGTVQKSVIDAVRCNTSYQTDYVSEKAATKLPVEAVTSGQSRALGNPIHPSRQAVAANDTSKNASNRLTKRAEHLPFTELQTKPFKQHLPDLSVIVKDDAAFGNCFKNIANDDDDDDEHSESLLGSLSRQHEKTDTIPVTSTQKYSSSEIERKKAEAKKKLQQNLIKQKQERARMLLQRNRGRTLPNSGFK